jgi:hypothetical protein
MEKHLKQKILDFTLLYRFKITLYILPFILHISNLYHKPSRHTVSKAFSKSINAQKTFIFLNFSSSKLPWITKVLSRVEHFFLKIVWFSFKRRNSSEKVLNLLYNTDVNNFPKQLLSYRPQTLYHFLIS